MKKQVNAVLLIVVSFFSFNGGVAQPLLPDRKADHQLQAKLFDIIKDFKGEVGIYVRHLKTGKTAAILADSLFPTASMIKIPIMVGLFNKIKKSELDYHAQLIYRDSLLYPGEDILGSFKDSATIALSKVVMLMITTSDNTASLWGQHLAGTGTEINVWLEKNGFEHTRVNSRTPGRQENQKLYGWGQTTPREMAELLVRIRQGKAVSPDASERMYRNLTRIYWGWRGTFTNTSNGTSGIKTGSCEPIQVGSSAGKCPFRRLCILCNHQKSEG